MAITDAPAPPAALPTWTTARIAAAAASSVIAVALTVTIAVTSDDHTGPAETAEPVTAEQAALAASNYLAATAATCETDAAAAFPGYALEPAAGWATLGCRVYTCEELATQIDYTRTHPRADARQTSAAAAWLVQRWEAAGCRQARALAEANR